MSITFTVPITPPLITTKKLIHFAADPVARRIVTDYETGYINGGGTFVSVSALRRVFTDETTPSFSDFVAACPASANLRRQVEQYEVTLDRPGSVD